MVTSRATRITLVTRYLIGRLTCERHEREFCTRPFKITELEKGRWSWISNCSEAFHTDSWLAEANPGHSDRDAILQALLPGPRYGSTLGPGKARMGIISLVCIWYWSRAGIKLNDNWFPIVHGRCLPCIFITRQYKVFRIHHYTVDHHSRCELRIGRVSESTVSRREKGSCAAAWVTTILQYTITLHADLHCFQSNRCCRLLGLMHYVSVKWLYFKQGGSTSMLQEIKELLYFQAEFKEAELTIPKLEVKFLLMFNRNAKYSRTSPTA